MNVIFIIIINHHDKLENLEYNTKSINCTIQSYGLWKYENNYGFTWKVNKIYIEDNNHIENNNLTNSILKNEINFNEDNEFIIKKKNQKT